MAQPQLVVRVAGNLEALKSSLKDGEKAVQATSAQIQKLANSFNGERLITHANNVTAAIKEVGVTTLTASQASRNLDMLERAMDKMRRTGEEIPPAMKRTAEQLEFVKRRSEELVPAGENMTRTYRQFDGILQSMGINIGPYVKGLEDIAMFAGKSATSLGLLGTAGAVLAAAIGGWQIGRAIAQFTDLDTKIGEATARLLGYGDVAAEIAGAKQDVINRAIESGAEATISYSGAIAWNIEIMRQQSEAKAKAKAEADALALAIQQEERATWSITETNADHFRQLQQALDASKEKKLADARASFAASQAQSFFRDETKAATTAVVEQTAALNERDESMKQIAAAEAARKAANDAFMNAPTLNDRDSFTTSSDLPGLTGFALDDVVNRFRQAGDRDKSQALKRALATLEAQEGRYKVTDNLSFFQMQKDQALLAQLRQLRGTIPGFASGVENFSGGLAYVHKGEMLANLPRGTDVIPAGSMGGTTLHLTLNINGAVLGTVRELTDMVSAEMMRIMRGQGYRAPAGA